MNEEDDEQDHVEGLPTATFGMVAGICSSLFGLFAALTNSLLLFTVFKDPYNYFRARARGGSRGRVQGVRTPP